MSWRSCRLGDVLTLKRGHDLPADLRQDGDVPVVSSSGITGYHNQAKATAPGVVTGRYGTLGEVFYLEQDYWPLNTALYVVNFKGSNPKFASYFLKNVLRDYQSDKAAVPGVDRNVLHEISVRVPDIKSQAAIADTLSAYDELIENNRRRMELVEQAARWLYQEWFVRHRFPALEQSRPFNDDLPEGWERKPLGEIADVVMGQSPQSKYYNEVGEGLPFHQGVADFGDRFVTNRVFTTTQSRIANPGDVLCSVRAPVGRLNVTLDRIVIGRGLAALRSRSGHQSFMLHQLRTHFFKEDLIGAGAIFASVTKSEFLSQKLLVPSSHLIETFEEITVPIDEQLRILWLQNNKLKAARDLLLPRLMSGAIAV